MSLGSCMTVRYSNVLFHSIMDSVALVSEDSIENDVIISCGPVQGTKWYVASLIVTNAAMGAGLLNFPSAFDQAGGIGAAMVVHVILVVFAATSLLVLGWCADLQGATTYQDAIGSLLGRWGRGVCAVCIALYMYAATVTYLVTVGDQTDRIFYDRIGADFCDKWYLNRHFIIPITSVVFIWPWCYSRKIDFLKVISSVATFGAFYLIFMVVLVYFTSDTSNVHVKTRPEFFSDVFLVIPTLCFSYQCHVSVIPVYACISPHNLRQYSYAVIVALGICFVAYSLVGIFGYLTFGTDIKADLLSCYPTENGAVLAGYVMYAVKTLLTIPILIFCGRVAIETLYHQINGGYDPILTDPTEYRRRIIIVTVWFVSSVTIAAAVPSIAFIIDFLGCLAAIFIFIFPGLCICKALSREDMKWTSRQRIVLHALVVLYAICGAFLFGLTFTQGVQVDSQSNYGSQYSMTQSHSRIMNDTQHCYP